jgi:hypothetical protein
MRPATAAGIAGIALGFVSILDRGVAGLFDLDYAFLTLLGVLAGAVGVYHLYRRREATRGSTTPAFEHPERRFRVPVPGDDADERIRTLSARRQRRAAGRTVRDRLREAAIRSLVVHAGYERQTAREAVESGAWTDDPVAASFLGVEGRYPVGLRIRALFGRADLSEVGARRSVEAIAAVIEP